MDCGGRQRVSVRLNPAEVSELDDKHESWCYLEAVKQHGGG